MCRNQAGESPVRKVFVCVVNMNMDVIPSLHQPAIQFVSFAQVSVELGC